MSKTEFNPDTDEVQQSFDSLKLYSQIARGGQKIVYKIEHPDYGMAVLKLVRPCNSKAKGRILREIFASTKLTGPKFSRIYDYGESEIGSAKILYILEEFLEGQDLKTTLSAAGKLSLPRTLNIAKSLLEALVEVDKEKIVHRDIKPGNIFITTDGRIVLIDFGIARHLALTSITHDFDLPGPSTPGYAAPEQVNNEKRKITCRTDLFSLGVVTYECLVGHNPFTKDCSSRREAWEKNVKFHPKPLSTFGVKKNVSDFVETCLQKHPNRRYANPGEALMTIRRIMSEEE